MTEKCSLGLAPEASRGNPYKLTDPERRNLRRVLLPEVAYAADGKDDPYVKHLFYRPLQEDRPEIMVAAVKTAGDMLRTDPETGWIDESEMNEEAASRLLAMVADMPADVPEEYRLLVWQAVFETDALQVAEHPYATEVAIRRAYDGDSQLIERIENVLNAVIGSKLKRISENLNEADRLTIDELGFGDFGPDSVLAVIRDYFPQTLMLYESIGVLSHIREVMRQIRALEEIKACS